MREIATAIPSLSVRPSVHPSVTRRHCVRTAKRNVEILLPSGMYLRHLAFSEMTESSITGQAAVLTL